MADNKKEDNIKVVSFRKDNSIRIYSNYIRVVSNASEITLQFCDIKPGANDEEQERILKEKNVKVEINTEVVIPVNVAQSLLKILQQQLSLVILNKDKNKD